MNNLSDDSTKNGNTLYRQLREMVFPIRQTDKPSVRKLKQSAFVIFIVMLVIISLSVGMAILFVM